MVSRASVASGDRLPNCRPYPGSHRGRVALSRFEQGRLAASQIFFRGLVISSLW